MEKITSKIITKEYKHKDYYCDICEAKIDSADEMDDGWISPSIGSTIFELDLRFSDRENYKFKKYKSHTCLCKTCKEKALENIFSAVDKVARDMGLKEV